MEVKAITDVSVDMTSVGLHWHPIPTYSFFYTSAKVPTSNDAPERNFQEQLVQVQSCTNKKCWDPQCSLKWFALDCRTGKGQCHTWIQTFWIQTQSPDCFSWFTFFSYCCGDTIAKASRRRHCLPNTQSLLWKRPLLHFLLSQWSSHYQ